MAEAAGAGAVGSTAVRFLDYSKIQRGKPIVINGDSNGYGTMLVQIAKYIVGPEGRVITTCSVANVDLLKGLGADEVVGYVANKPSEKHLAETEFDAIIDVIGRQERCVGYPAYLGQ